MPQATQELCIVIRREGQPHMIILHEEGNPHYKLKPANYEDMARLHGADK